MLALVLAYATMHPTALIAPTAPIVSAHRMDVSRLPGHATPAPHSLRGPEEKLFQFCVGLGAISELTMPGFVP